MGGGMMGGGMMAGSGWAGDSEQGWNMPCLGGGDYSETAPSDATQVIIGNYNFNPQTLTVKVGTTVTWTNMDFVGHNVEAGTHEDEGHEDESLESPILGHMQSFSYTFTEAGEYEYHCDPHPYMEGRIIVVK